MIGTLAAETGIPPHVLEDTDWCYLAAIADHLRAKADAMSGRDPADEIDWDETYGVTDGA